MKHRIAVITGASSGIGMELARLFAADGYELILTARRADRLQELAGELGKTFGVAVHVVPMDISQPFAGAALWREISAIAPEIEVLVNNAGFGDTGDFAQQQPERIEGMIHLNISTLTSLTRLALPGMIERRSGKILNVASLAGLSPGGPGMSVYFATKSYVLSFTRGIRRELRGTGVTVTALCPGPTHTGFEKAANAQNTRLFKWATPMEAAAVARAGYRGLQRGSAVVLPGWRNKLMAISMKFSPAGGVVEANRILLAERRQKRTANYPLQ